MQNLLINSLLFQDLEDRISKNLTKFNTEINTSNNINERTSITHSNSELNVCPHTTTTGSTKSKFSCSFFFCFNRK